MLRNLARSYLAWLTKRTLARHKPFLIAVLGYGPTSIAREVAFSVLKEKLPARRNDEVPEAEFSIPLTVLDHVVYPESFGEWVLVAVRYTFQLFFIKRVAHGLVIEIPEITEDLQQYWLEVLDPELILTIDGTRFPLPHRLRDRVRALDTSPIDWEIQLARALANILHLEEIDAELALATLQIPAPRMRVFRLSSDGAARDQILIDATHQYYPVAWESVAEMAEQFGDKFVYGGSKLPGDPESELVHAPQGQGTIILRGPKVKVLPRWKQYLQSAESII